MSLPFFSFLFFLSFLSLFFFFRRHIVDVAVHRFGDGEGNGVVDTEFERNVDVHPGRSAKSNAGRSWREWKRDMHPEDLPDEDSQEKLSPSETHITVFFGFGDWAGAAMRGWNVRWPRMRFKRALEKELKDIGKADLHQVMVVLLFSNFFIFCFLL